MPKRKKIKLHEQPASRLYHLPCIDLIDIKNLPDGPWKDDLSFEQGTYKDIPYVLDRKDHGAWCLYIAIPQGFWLHGPSTDHLDFTGMEMSWHDNVPAIQGTANRQQIPSGYDKWLGYYYNRSEYLTPIYDLKNNQKGALEEPVKKEYVTINKAREDIKKVIDSMLHEEGCLEDAFGIHRKLAAWNIEDIFLK